LPIHTVLFDADGVLQRPLARWGTALVPVFGSADPVRLEPFLQDVLEAESNALCTPAGFEDALARVLIKWGRTDRLAEALGVLNAIEPYEEILDVVRSLKLMGVDCHIASNQQAGRARHMSEVLKYGTLFGREFYSCSLGVAKPDVAFFEHILVALGVHASTVLFLDDRLENIEAARRAGLAAAVFEGASGAQALHRILGDHGLVLA
jgi:putative hydrolase of the HAD superfamily